jgi:hypothetical protein
MYTKKTLLVFRVLDGIDSLSQSLYDYFGNEIIIKVATRLYHFVENFREDLPAKSFNFKNQNQ